MKKSLIALAVLAASGAAMAQSSVTLYGIADVWFGSNKNENTVAGGGAGNSLSQTRLDSGGVNGSRWGLRGSEDLGGGLKANFQFEQGFNIDSGVAAAVNTVPGVTPAPASAFARQSWVGFSGGFGAVRLGRTLTPYDDIDLSSAPVLASALAPSRNVFRSQTTANAVTQTGNPALGGATSRPDNSIYYQAPDFGGFSGAISYSLGENKTATDSASSTTSMNLTYGAGPVKVQFGYQVDDIANTVLLPSDKKFMQLNGSYDLGVVVLKAGVGKAKNIGNIDGADASDYQVGVDYKASPALTLSAGYARSKDNDTAGDVTRKGFGLGAKYDLSKRTFLYGGYEYDKTDVTTGPDGKHSLFAVGVQHRF